MSKTQPARGMRDFLPSDVRKRNYVINIIKEVYESYGFEPLETPSVENLETLTGKYGEEGNQLIYKILKRGEKLTEELTELCESAELQSGKTQQLSNSGNSVNSLSDLALRYDLTVPLARVVANYKNDLPKFFKRYQIQPVWRADRPARGRYREFYQCDVDAIGSSSMVVEAELISAVCEILERLGFEDFEIKINHRQLLTGMLNIAGVPAHLVSESLIALDKWDKIGENGVNLELTSKGIEAKVALDLVRLFRKVKPDINTNISRVGTDNFPKPSREPRDSDEVTQTEFLYNKSDELRKSLLELKAIWNWSLAKFVIDPFLVRGLSYYTGAIFEIVLTNGDFAGSIGGGGRYDGLIGMFGKEQIPACGFSLGLERILVVMEERGEFDRLIKEGKIKNDSADVMIACFDENLVGECLKLASELRQKGLRVLVYPEANQKAKPYKYAEQINVPFVCLLRESELAENRVAVKNVVTGEQEVVDRQDVGEKVKGKAFFV